MTPAAPQYQTDAVAPAAGALLKLNPRGATPPTNAYVQAGQALRWRTWTSLTNIVVTMNLQMLLPDGTISKSQWTMTTQFVRSANNMFIPLDEGFLLSVQVQTGNTNQANRVFTQVQLYTALSAQGIGLMVLAQGYPNLTSFLSWPNGTIASALEGNGGIVDVTGTTPGAGSEISETVPTGAIWRVKSFTFKLTTSSTAANRIPHLIVDDGTNVLLDAPAQSVLAASLTGRYVTGDNAISAAAVDGTQWLQSVANMRLPAGYRIRTLTTNLQAGDQYTAPQYEVDEYQTD